jgi:predicted DNA-binding transcriptional regulator AlpA
MHSFDYNALREASIQGFTPGLMSAETVMALLGVKSRVTLWRWVRRKILPAPVKVGAKTAWRTSEIFEFIASRERVPWAPKEGGA